MQRPTSFGCRSSGPLFLAAVAALTAGMFFGAASPLHAGGRGEEERISDGRENWTCRFTEFEAGGVQQRYRYLLTSMPLLLLDRLEDIPEHVLSVEEREARARRLVRERIRAHELQISSLLEKKDELFLDGKQAKQRETGEEIEGLHAEIEELREILESEGSLSSKVDVVKKLPFEAALEDAKRSLAPHPNLPLREFADEREADAIVYGRLEQVEEALYMSLKLYNRDLDASREIYSGTVFPDRVERSAEDAARELATVLLGRKWAHLAIDVSPDHAEVRLGGKRYAGGDRVLRYLVPDTYEVEAEAEGYLSESRSLRLEQATRSELSFRLQPEETVSFSVTTDPAGAEIFSGAVSLGRSPMTVQEVVLPITILAKREGFYDYHRVVQSPPENEMLEVNLHPLSIGKEKIIEAARGRFYRGMAGFFLSLPITIISYGLSTEYAYAYNDSLGDPGIDSDERARLHGLSTLWYTAYLGGLFLNGVFLIDSVVQMNQYIQAAEGRP
jgi:hypothetical protein